MAQHVTSVAVQENCPLQDRDSDAGETIAERLEELLDVTDLFLVLDLTMCFWRVWSTVSIADRMHESSSHSCNTGVLKPQGFVSQRPRTMMKETTSGSRLLVVSFTDQNRSALVSSPSRHAR